jgi:dethiobiotin synthetase
MSKPFFITSSGTGIGKTFVTTALCRQLQAQAVKPIISGYDPNDAESDLALILGSCGLPASQVDAISPWRFAAPLAPNLAAAKEDKVIVFEKLVAFCKERALAAPDIFLVEGCGGVMAPITHQHTCLDWMAALGWPVILVVGSYLGSISHTLTALEALRARNICVQAIVISESENSSVSLYETAEGLASFIPSAMPVITVPRVQVSVELWKDIVDLSVILASPVNR